MLEEAAVKAKDLMTTDVAVVRPSTPLLEAVRLLAKRGISGMPVVDDAGAIVGMFSEGDLLRWRQGYSEKQERWLEMLADGHDLAPTFLNSIREQGNTVKAVMSKDPIASVTEDTFARDVAELMYARNVKRLPVLRDGKLVGIIARSDLVKALAELLKPATG